MAIRQAEAVLKLDNSLDMQTVEAGVIAVKNKHHAVLSAYDELYQERKKLRRKKRLPTLCIVGYSYSGKDTFAEYLGTVSKLQYGRSASFLLLPFIADSVGLTTAEIWMKRHTYSDFLSKWCNAFRGSDYSLVTRMCLAVGDMVVGSRGFLEFCAATDIVDASIWIENSVAGSDITVEFAQDDCDFTVTNNGTKKDLFNKAKRLAKILGIERQKNG